MTYPLFPALDEPLKGEALCTIFEAWIAHRARSGSKQRSEKALRDETAGVYREMWQAFATHCAARNLTLDDIETHDLQGFLAARGAGAGGAAAGSRMKGLGLSPRYARRFLTLIDRVTRFEAARRGTTPNVAALELLEAPRYRYAEAAHNDPLPEHLTSVQAKRLIAYVTAVRNSELVAGPMPWKEVRDRTAVALMLGGGLAPGDVRALTLDGVVSEGGGKGGLPWKLKLPGNGNSPARETPLASWAGRLLAYWLKIRMEQGIPGSAVFPSTAGGRAWSHTRCFEACKAVLEGSGLPSDSGGLFKLRHTFALRQLARGKSETEVARWLGLLDVGGMERYRRVVMQQVDVI